MSSGENPQAPREESADARLEVPDARGPRDWTPSEEVDEAFSPEDIPQSEPSAPASRPGPMKVGFGLGALLLAVAILGLAGVFPISGTLIGLSGTAGVIAIAVAVWWAAPTGRDSDDDGSRV